jgi:hypothetical protein
MNDILKIAAGVVLALVALIVVGALLRFVIWVILPLALALLLSFGVAVVWRRLVSRKKEPGLASDIEPAA